MLRALIPLAVLIGAICWAAHVVAGVVIAVALLAYFISLVAAPMRKCASCGGGKTHDDVMGSRAFRRCWTCKGHGDYARWGVIVFRRNVYKKIQAGEHGRNF
jgi:hypothetical protein